MSWDADRYRCNLCLRHDPFRAPADDDGAELILAHLRDVHGKRHPLGVHVTAETGHRPTQDELDAALVSFHAAIAQHDGGFDDCGSMGHAGHDWVDGSATACVTALLKAGWTPPAT